MNKQILIVKNITREGPGLLGQVLDRQRIGYAIADLSQGEPVPDPLQFDALIILGGPQSANDESPLMRKEIDMAHRALQAGLPCLGICLGLQVLAKAAGGRVIACPVKETGFFDHEGNPFRVKLNGEGSRDPLFKNLNERFRVFQLHGETVETSGSMMLLASGKHCRNQVVRVGARAYGLQCHFELTAVMLEEWARFDPDLHTTGIDTLMKQFSSVREEYTQTGLSLMTNFLKIAEIA
jgi:GMP synthase (glutamine-hydrolysing)